MTRVLMVRHRHRTNAATSADNTPSKSSKATASTDTSPRSPTPSGIKDGFTASTLTPAGGTLPAIPASR